MDTVYAKIKARRKALGMTQEELAEKVGYNGKSMISRVERGEINLTTSKIEAFAKALRISTYDLLSETGEGSYIEYPVVGSVKAGYNGLIFEDTADSEQVPLEWIKGDSPDSFFILRISGDSMYPLLMDSDRILVHKCSSVPSGSLAVMRINGEEATVKRVVYKPGEDWLELHAVNPAYPPKRIEGADLELCEVIGEVKRSIRVF